MPYEEDLTYIHDAGFTRLARNAAVTVLKILRQQKFKSGLVVDLGCGSGVLAERLTSAGYEVLGLDISESMLRLGRKRAPGAQFVRGSLFRVRLPKCVAITAVGECLNYLFDRRGTTQLGGLFRRVHQALTPQGIFVFDVALPGDVSKPAQLYVEGNDWAILVDKQEDPKSQILTRKMTIFRKVGKTYRRSEEVHRQRLYPVAEVTQELRKAGFQVAPLKGYGNDRLPRGCAGFVATKL